MGVAVSALFNPVLDSKRMFKKEWLLVNQILFFFFWSSFLLVIFLGLFVNELLEWTPFLFSLYRNCYAEGHWCAPKHQPLPFLSLYSESFYSVVTDLLKFVSLCSQNPWFILSYYCCLSWWLLFIFPKWKLPSVQSLGLSPSLRSVSVKIVLQSTVITYTPSVNNSKLALTFLLSSNAPFSKTQ